MTKFRKLDPHEPDALWHLDFRVGYGGFRRRAFPTRTAMKKWMKDHRPHQVLEIHAPKGFIRAVDKSMREHVEVFESAIASHMGVKV